MKYYLALESVYGPRREKKCRRCLRTTKGADASAQSNQPHRFFFLFKKYRIYTCYERNSNILGRFCSRECWFVNDQIGNPGDKIFSRRCPYKAEHDRKCFCCMKSTNTYIVDQSVQLGSPSRTLVI